MRGDDHLDRGPVVGGRELQLLVVGFNTKLVGTVSPASTPSLVLQDVCLDRGAWNEAGAVEYEEEETPGPVHLDCVSQSESFTEMTGLRGSTITPALYSQKIHCRRSLRRVEREGRYITHGTRTGK